MDFSPSCPTHKIPISWHKTSKTQHFMNYWCFGSWNPVFLHFIKPEYLKKSRDPGNILGKYGKYFCGNLKLKKNEISEPLGVYVFEFLKFWILELLIIRNDKIWKSWKVEDEEWPCISFPLIKSTKAWIWISFGSKNMKRKYGKTNQLFYFQVRASSWHSGLWYSRGAKKMPGGSHECSESAGKGPAGSQQGASGVPTLPKHLLR